MKSFFVVIFFCFSIISIADTEIKGLDSKIRKVSVGMKKNKVVSILGSDFFVVLATNEQVVLEYSNNDTSFYKLVFVDDKLKELKRERFKRRIPIFKGYE